MWCTSCNTPFNWMTGKIVTTKNYHNDHYVDYLKRRGQGHSHDECNDRLAPLQDILDRTDCLGYKEYYERLTELNDEQTTILFYIRERRSVIERVVQNSLTAGLGTDRLTTVAKNADFLNMQAIAACHQRLILSQFVLEAGIPLVNQATDATNLVALKQLHQLSQDRLQVLRKVFPGTIPDETDTQLDYTQRRDQTILVQTGVRT